MFTDCQVEKGKSKSWQGRVSVTYVMECSFSCTAVRYTEGLETIVKSVVEKSRSESWLVPQAAQLRQD